MTQHKGERTWRLEQWSITNNKIVQALNQSACYSRDNFRMPSYFAIFESMSKSESEGEGNSEKETNG